MRLELHLLGRVAWRALIAFVALEALMLLLALADVARRDPLLAAAGMGRLVPILLLHGAAPCLAAALAGAIAASFAGWREDGELVAAAAAGAPPRRFMLPVLSLALLAAGWTAFHESERFPRARAAKHAEARRLARDPEVLVRALEASSDRLGSFLLALDPAGQGRFEAFHAAEVDAAGELRAFWRAPSGAVVVPPARDVLRLDLEQPELVRRDGRGRLERLSAAAGRLERPLDSTRRTDPARRLPREASLRALLGSIGSPSLEQRSAAREELARRLGSALTPLAAAFAAIAAGLCIGRRGGALGLAGGVAIVGLVLVPGVALGARLVGDGHALAVVLVPHALVALLAAPVIGRWRIG